MSAIVSPEHVKSFVRARIEACRKPTHSVGAYSFDPGGSATAAASCDAALTLHVIDQLPTDECVRREWIDYLNAFQDPETGWFLADDGSNDYAGPGRKPMWLFGMVLRALNVLGGKPRYALSFLNEWTDHDALCRWMQADKDIMHLGIVWLRHLRNAVGPDWDAWRDMFFELLERREPWSGPMHPKHQANWNRVRQQRGQSLTLPSKIAQDPFHTLFLYYASNREIPNIEALIDWFLLEQDESGFIIEPASYSHMDGLSLLASLSSITRYRHRDIEIAADRALDWLLDKREFAERWAVDLHLLLARCETIAVGLRILDQHPFTATVWRSAWDIDLWRVDQNDISRTVIASLDR